MSFDPYLAQLRQRSLIEPMITKSNLPLMNEAEKQFNPQEYFFRIYRNASLNTYNNFTTNARELLQSLGPQRAFLRDELLQMKFLAEKIIESIDFNLQ